MQPNVKSRSTTKSTRVTANPTRCSVEGRTATEDRYRALLSRRARMGQSLREFAEMVGIPVGTLAWWQHELRRRDRDREQREAPAFLPVQIMSGVGPLETPGAAVSEQYEVVLGGGRVIRVSPKFDPATLAALVRVVEATSC